MARILNGPFKGARGKLGNVVFKQINGKTFVCQKPHHRKTTDERVLARRRRFSVNMKLSKCINNIKEAKKFSDRSLNKNGSAFNLITKMNYVKVGFNGEVLSPFLTPDSISLDFIGSAEIIDDILTIDFCNNVNLIGCDTENVMNVKTAGVLRLSNPNRIMEPEYVFLNLVSSEKRFSKEKTSAFEINLSNFDYNLLDSFYDYTLYMGLFLIDACGNVVKELSTFTINLES